MTQRISKELPPLIIPPSLASLQTTVLIISDLSEICTFSCLRVTCGETFLVCESRVGKGSGVTSEVGSPRRDTGGASQSW